MRKFFLITPIYIKVKSGLIEKPEVNAQELHPKKNEEKKDLYLKNCMKRFKADHRIFRY